jgi:hypothetical protein
VVQYSSNVHVATPAEAQKAICTDSTFLASQKLLVVTIPHQGCIPECCDYVIKPPVVWLYTPPSRATHTSIAYDIQRNCIVFFKDSWRVACDGLLREGKVYAILNNVGIPNIPHCSASSDIGDDAYHSTNTNQFANASWAMMHTPTFTPHQHHRLILDDIGLSLDTFCSAKKWCVPFKQLWSVHILPYPLHLNAD